MNERCQILITRKEVHSIIFELPIMSDRRLFDVIATALAKKGEAKKVFRFRHLIPDGFHAIC